MNQHISKSMGRQQGFTLVELGISMVLIASMVLAGFYVVKRIRTDAAINAAIASANVSMNKANAAFSGSDSTAGANLTTLAAMNIWPKERLTISEVKSGTGCV
jgi:prepilin-type N-terminal cleavage/methylation domain-containing protein